MAESATVGELLVRIRADVTDLERGLNQAQGSVAAMSTRSVPGLRAVEGGLRAIAFQAAGLPGPIGRISGALLHIGIGGTATLAVLAGVAAIVLAWRKLTESAREAEKAQRDAIRAGLESPLRDAQVKFILADQAFAKAVAERDKARDRPFLAAANPAKYADDLGRANIKVQEARAATQAWRDTVAELNGAFDELFKNVDAIGLPERLRLPGLNEGRFGPSVIGTSLSEIIARPDLGKRAVPSAAALIAGDRFIEDFRKRIRERYEEMRLVGESIGQALASGINAVLSGGNFFKSFFGTLLNIAVNVASTLAGRAIGNALFPGIGAAAGVVLSGSGNSGMLGSVVGPAGIDFSTFPAATNPLAAARDGQWQSFFRESGLVARNMGYR